MTWTWWSFWLAVVGLSAGLCFLLVYYTKDLPHDEPIIVYQERLWR